MKSKLFKVQGQKKKFIQILGIKILVKPKKKLPWQFSK